MYNTTNITNANDLGQIFYAVNQLSIGWLATFILFVLFLMIWMVFKGRYDTTVLLLGDSFIKSFIGVIFFWLVMVSWMVLVAPMLLFFAMLLKEIFWSS